LYVREKLDFLEGNERFFLSRGLTGNTSARAILTWPGHTGNELTSIRAALGDLVRLRREEVRKNSKFV